MYVTDTESVAANPLIIVQHQREQLALAGQPYLLPPSANTYDALYSNEHYSTYGTQHSLTTNNSFARTLVQRAPTAITLFPLSTTLPLEQCTSSCHMFPLRRPVGFIYVSTHNAIIGGKICIRVLPASPFLPCDAPGLSRYPYPQGKPCISVLFRWERKTLAILYALRGFPVGVKFVFFHQIESNTIRFTIKKNTLRFNRVLRYSNILRSIE